MHISEAQTTWAHSGLGGLDPGARRTLGNDRFVKRLELAIAARQDVGHSASIDLADGRLGNAGSGGDLLLGEPFGHQIADEFTCFHGRIPLRLFCHAHTHMQAGLNPGMPRNEDTLAQRVKLKRKEHGLTQAQLAEKSGLNQSDISKIELGLIVKTTAIVRLAAALHVSPKWLEDGGEESATDRETFSATSLVLTDELEVRFIAALRTLLPEDRERIESDVFAKAEEMRRHAAFILASAPDASLYRPTKRTPPLSTQEPGTTRETVPHKPERRSHPSRPRRKE